MSSPPHHDVNAMSPMTPRWHSCHLCHRHGINDTIMATMTPRCPGAGKWRFCCKTMAQYGTVCNICPPHLTMTYMLCHPRHHDGTHVTYVTDIESMTHCPWAEKGLFWCKTMAQYGTVCNICPLHLNMIYVLCHPWHHDGTHVTYVTVIESMTHCPGAGKGRSWHNMAQYVIYVLPTSPWRICYVTHDTAMTLMSPMSQTWHQWHHHGNNDTTLSWSWERAILL